MHRAQVVETFLNSPGNIESLDIGKDLLPDFVARQKMSPLNCFLLEVEKKLSLQLLLPGIPTRE